MVFFIRAQLFQQVGYLPLRYRGLRDLFHRTFLDGNAKKNSDRQRKGPVAAAGTRAHEPGYTVVRKGGLFPGHHVGTEISDTG
jgi:hypothetical protein